MFSWRQITKRSVGGPLRRQRPFTDVCPNLETLETRTQPSFLHARPFSVGTAPTAVVVANLGNGHPDIVTANSGDNTVSVLLGKGHDTYPLSETFAVGSDPTSVAVADLTGDGMLDIITANSGDNTVTVLLGNGAGGFSPDPFSSPGLAPGTFAVGSGPDSVAVADLGNGHLDIVTANGSDNTVSVLLGNGAGAFQSTEPVAVGSGPKAVAVADVNGDGKPDIITANYLDNTVSVLLGNGAGTFQKAMPIPVGKGPKAVAVADLFGDGKPDIITANNYYSYYYYANTSTVSVLLGNGAGTFQAAQNITLQAGSDPDSVAVADVNGNGMPDIVTANFGKNTVSVLQDNGQVTFQVAQNIPVGSEPDSVAVAALTGDGKPDIITANFKDNTVSVLLDNGNGTAQTTGALKVGSGPESLVTADLTDDGRMDIVTANFKASTVSVLLGNANGTFSPDPFSSPGLTPGTFAVGSGPDSVAVADLGNGHLDIVTANYSDSTVSVLLGNGAGDFQAAKNFAVGSHPKSVAVASLTGDGKPDIVTANFGSYNGGYGGYGGYGGFGFYGGYNGGTVSVLLGDGHGNFSPDPSSSLGSSPGTFNVGYGPDSVAVAKLTGDGTPDIITANYGSDTVSVLLGNGQGDFSPDPYPTPGFTPGTFAVGYGPKSVAVADVNGDGTLDIITANYIASTVSVLLGNGAGASAPSAPSVQILSRRRTCLPELSPLAPARTRWQWRRTSMATARRTSSPPTEAPIQ